LIYIRKYEVNVKRRIIYIYILSLNIILHRCKKVYDGVTHAGKLYPNAYLIMILIGTLKGWSYKYEMSKQDRAYVAHSAPEKI